MKFTCLQENLAKGLNIVTKAVPTKGTLPILTNVLINAQNGRLKLSATNLETTITTYVGASIEKEGAITVPAKLLRDFIANLPPSTVTFQLHDEILNLTSDKTKSKFNGISAEDYPVLPELSDDIPSIQVDPKAFLNSISYVAFAAATDESRPIFTGVFLKFEAGKLTVAASDGYRLAEKTIPAEGSVETFTTIIPAKTLIEIARIFGAATEPIKIALNAGENLVMFKGEDTLISSRILDGQYPNYKAIVPTAQILSAEFIAQELLEAVRLTSIFSKDNNPIKIKFDPSGNIHIITSTQEIGEHQSKITAQIEGEAMEVAFNSKYLIDLLNNAKSERIKLTSNGKLAPCLITLVEDTEYLHIIMPMQVQE